MIGRGPPFAKEGWQSVPCHLPPLFPLIPRLLNASKSPLSSEKSWPVGEYAVLIVNIALSVIIVKRLWRIQLPSNEEE